MATTDATPRHGRSEQDGTPSGTAPFPVSPDSPFADGYDIASERDALADLVAADNPDRGGPRWTRLVELRERENELRQMTRSDIGQRVPAAAVAIKEASGIAGLGQLADATPDTMTLHTKDAYRMFTGRPADASGKGQPIPGGKRFAAVLKSIWHLSANDNPYADWILVRVYDGLVAIRAHLSRVITAREEAIGLLKRKGLTLSVMASRSPKTVELGFRSPYGYATAEAIVEFDYYVRMIKTLIHKDRMSDEGGRAAIREVGRKMRALFLDPIRWERHLLREELRQLSRSDFLPGADELAHMRVRAAVALFGEVPRKVFTGVEAPRHTRRRVQLSDAELRLLEQASLTAAGDSPQPDTELL
ncbi:MAG: TIGR03761 family integrating conjugative element protein [Burkholderiales bacterium]|nr:TIGR03761 family integrating conjugative element protein [Burkholderiales bacterium]